VQLEDKLESLGPAYLSGEVQAEAFLELARKSNGRYLAVFLMDQSKTSGVGNYILSGTLMASSGSRPQTLGA
jgi:formamidopyrimidine-DNA glycosylase